MLHVPHATSDAYCLLWYMVVKRNKRNNKIPENKMAKHDFKSYGKKEMQLLVNVGRKKKWKIHEEA